MPCPGPFVDIHCHIVAGIDDGPKDWEESLVMARLAVAEGIHAIVATPHQLGNYGQNRGSMIRKATARLQELLCREGIPLQILPGADVRIDADLVRKIRQGDVLTLADGGRYVLLELPHEMYLPLDRLLSDLGAAGLVGVLSHPERNQGILKQPQVLEPLLDAGCLLQVTAGSLAGTFGPPVQAFTESLLSQGYAHFIATDAHGSRARRPLMARAYQRAAELVGEQRAVELCCTNPACVVNGKRVVGGRRERASSGILGWFRRRKAG